GGCFLEQPVARPQRPLERVDACAVLGIDCKYQPIEKTAAVACRTDEQPVHFRHQPDDPQMIGEGGCGSGAPLVEAEPPRRGAAFGWRIDAGPETDGTERAFGVGRNRPGTIAFGVGDLFEGCTPEAATGGKKRDCFEKIGLAGTVWTNKYNRGIGEAQIELGGGAEIYQLHTSAHVVGVWQSEDVC